MELSAGSQNQVLNPRLALPAKDLQALGSVDMYRYMDAYAHYTLRMHCTHALTWPGIAWHNTEDDVGPARSDLRLIMLEVLGACAEAHTCAADSHTFEVENFKVRVSSPEVRFVQYPGSHRCRL